MVERIAEQVYWDLLYDRNTTQPFTEIRCPECDEWSGRDNWAPGAFDDAKGEIGILCPSCERVTIADQGYIEIR